MPVARHDDDDEIAIIKTMNAEYPFIAIAPRVVAPNRALSMGQIELKCVLMLN